MYVNAETELTFPYHSALSTKRTVTVIMVYMYVILIRKWKNTFKKKKEKKKKGIYFI